MSLNSIRLHLKIPFLKINLLNINFPKHLITGLDFPQIFIPTTRGRIWAVLMYILTELNYMKDSCSLTKKLTDINRCLTDISQF